MRQKYGINHLVFPSSKNKCPLWMKIKNLYFRIFELGKEYMNNQDICGE